MRTLSTRVAEGAGLTIGEGIVVNHDLEADPEARVFAIGDCAEVLCSDPTCTVCPPRRGRGPAGLVGPGWQQASWLARRFARELGEPLEPLEPLATAARHHPAQVPSVASRRVESYVGALGGRAGRLRVAQCPMARAGSQVSSRRPSRGVVALACRGTGRERAVASGTVMNARRPDVLSGWTYRRYADGTGETAETARVRCAGVPRPRFHAIAQCHAPVEVPAPRAAAAAVVVRCRARLEA